MSLAHAMTEEQLLSAIVDAAKVYGWLVHHDRRSDQANPQWGTHPGFPDLVLVKKGRLPLFLELKSEKGKVSPAQQGWLDELGAFGNLIRPSDLEIVLTVLK